MSRGFGFENVGLERHGRIEIEGVNFEVAAGSVNVVVGGDGAGKTTLARMMAGLLGPSSGRVIRPERRHIGYQPEGSGVWGDLTVLENLRFVASAHRLSKTERQRRIETLLESTQLGAARDRLGSQLSGGMRQKLGVAMAVLSQPQVLVLDEPTTGLDPISRTEVWTLLAHQAARGTAIFSTTTYLEEAERGSSVLVMDQGRPLASGRLSEVIGSFPGRFARLTPGLDARFSWRRGATRRAWFPDGVTPPGAEALTPDLADLVMATALEREARG